MLTIKEDKLYLYCGDKKLLTVHDISILKGEFIRNTDHQRKKSGTIDEIQEKASKILGNSQAAQLFLELLKKDKPRYYRDNLQFIRQKIKIYPQKIINESLIFCIENKQFNSSVLLQVIQSKYMADNDTKQAETSISKIELPEIPPDLKDPDFDVEKSDINSYQKLFDTCRN